MKIAPDVEAALKRQLKAFREKFGRDAGPGDPVFFDPDADTPSPMPDITEGILAAMQAADLPPEFAYAYRKTGLIGLGADKSAWEPDDIEEWNAAVDEGRALEEAKKRPGRPDPGTWNTEIAELLLTSFSKENLAQVRECLAAIAPVEARGMNVVTRIELAANFVASALELAYEAGDVTGTPGDGAETFAQTEELILRRAREIYSQGHG